MPQGIQVFNADGTPRVDTSTRLSRVIAIIYVGGGSSGSYTHAGFLTGTPFGLFIPASGGAHYVSISFSGSTLYWAKTQNAYPTTGNIVAFVY